MFFNNDRISHWYAGALLSWVIFFGVIGIPIFHVLLSASIAKVATYVGVCCGTQLAVTPWFFSARATRENPTGKLARRSVAVIVWITSTALILAFLLQYGQPVNPRNTQLRVVMFATPTVIGLAFLAVVGIIFHDRKS